MMGLSGWLHWTAWFIKYFLFLLISVVIETIFFTVGTSSGKVITFTDPTVVFVFLLSYAVATMTFCFALSTFFSKGDSF